MNQNLQQKAEEIVTLLKARKFTLSSAESCTGGMVAQYITSVSGVSQIFELGITSYSCRIKNKILGVSPETLEKYGAISEQTSREMAVNIRKLADSDFGVSVTGAAGPDGSEGHDPGLVFIALAHKNGVKVKKLTIDPKSRNFVRETATYEVFKLIKQFVEEC